MQRVHPWWNCHSHLLRHHWIHVCAKNPAPLWESRCYCCSHRTHLLSDEGDPLDDVITGFPPGLQRSWCGVDITEQWTGGVWELSCMTCWQEQYVFTLTSVSLHYTFKMFWLEAFLQFSESCFCIIVASVHRGKPQEDHWQNPEMQTQPPSIPHTRSQGPSEKGSLNQPLWTVELK